MPLGGAAGSDEQDRARAEEQPAAPGGAFATAGTFKREHAGSNHTIVAVNVDRNRARDEIADYVKRRKLPFAVWLDPDDRASQALGASTYPVNVLVDREGKVVWRRAGAIRAEDPELRAALDAALAAP